MTPHLECREAVHGDAGSPSWSFARESAILPETYLGTYGRYLKITNKGAVVRHRRE